MIAVDFQQWFEHLTRPTENKSDTHKLCVACHTRLSEYLSAYYGRDPFEAKMCSPCRKQTKNRP